MKRKESQWHCSKCKEPITKPCEPTRPYTCHTLGKDGVWQKNVRTVEMQLEESKTCYDCDGFGTLTAYDVQTAEQLDSLEYDEQRRVAQQIDQSTPYPVVIAVLEQVLGALKHEDKDYVPAIKVAITALKGYQ